MQEETDGHIKADIRLWVPHCSDGWAWLFCLLCMGYDHAGYQPNNQRYAHDNHQTHCPNTNVGQRYDKIATESKYCSTDARK